MSEVVRLSVSLEQPLLDRLEALRAASGYANRSELFRDLIRARLVERDWEAGAEDALGTITLLYDHHVRRLQERLTSVQHDHEARVLAATHVHLDHDLCAEMIMVRGKARDIGALADALGREKGVLHAALAMSSAGGRLREG